MPRNIITLGKVDSLLLCRCDILRKAMLADFLTIKGGEWVLGWQQGSRGDMGGVR